MAQPMAPTSTPTSEALGVSDIIYLIAPAISSRRDLCAFCCTCRLVYGAAHNLLLRDATVTSNGLRAFVSCVLEIEHRPSLLRSLTVGLAGPRQHLLDMLSQVIRRADNLATVHILSFPSGASNSVSNALQSSISLKRLIIDGCEGALRGLPRASSSLEILTVPWLPRTPPAGAFSSVHTLRIKYCDDFVVEDWMRVAFPRLKQLAIDDMTSDYDYPQALQNESPKAILSLTTLKCDVSAAYALCVGHATSATHLAMSGLILECKATVDSSLQSDEGLIELLLSSEHVQPRVLELGCLAFVQNVRRMMRVLLPWRCPQQCLKIHFCIFESESNRCCLEELRKLMALQMGSLLELHVSFFTLSWTAFESLEKQSSEHPRPGEFASASFGGLDFWKVARGFFTDVPALEAFSIKVFNRDTVAFRRSSVL